MMGLHEGDHVEIDLLGNVFHGRWGIVHSVNEAGVWVRLVEYSRLQQRRVLSAPMKFEQWELRVLRYARRWES